MSSPALHWFHATKRQTASDYIEIFSAGCRPSPHPTETKQLELHLSIIEPHVYCYLGRTLEQFGDFCIVLKPDEMPTGEMSPFDSGGLARKIKPVSGWGQADQKAYLSSFSFQTTNIQTNISTYPATDVDAYLAAEKPAADGPHKLWAGPSADIWKLNTDWRAWTWEGRWKTLPTAHHLLAWTCSPALWPNILAAVESHSASFPLDFMERYRPGGVSALVSAMRKEQTGA